MPFDPTASNLVPPKKASDVLTSYFQAVETSGRALDSQTQYSLQQLSGQLSQDIYGLQSKIFQAGIKRDQAIKQFETGEALSNLRSRELENQIRQAQQNWFLEQDRIHYQQQQQLDRLRLQEERQQAEAKYLESTLDDQEVLIEDLQNQQRQDAATAQAEASKQAGIAQAQVDLDLDKASLSARQADQRLALQQALLRDRTKALDIQGDLLSQNLGNKRFALQTQAGFIQGKEARTAAFLTSREAATTAQKEFFQFGASNTFANTSRTFESFLNRQYHLSELHKQEALVELQKQQVEVKEKEAALKFKVERKAISRKERQIVRERDYVSKNLELVKEGARLKKQKISSILASKTASILSNLRRSDIQSAAKLKNIKLRKEYNKIRQSLDFAANTLKRSYINTSAILASASANARFQSAKSSLNFALEREKIKQDSAKYIYDKQQELYEIQSFEEDVELQTAIETKNKVDYIKEAISG